MIRVAAHAAIDAAAAELLWVERTMTRFTDTSDIGRANRLAARDGVLVTAETAFVTEAALAWADALDGRYDPAVGAVCALWDVSNRHEPPADDRVAELAGRRFHRTVEVGTSGGGHVLRFHGEGARLDLGSAAKGYAVDRAVERAARAGDREGARRRAAATSTRSARRRTASRGRSASSRRPTSARSPGGCASPTAPSRRRARTASSSATAATSITT